MRGRSYSPSPPRAYSRRGRSPSPRGRYGGGRGRDLPTSLLVRNLRHDCSIHLLGLGALCPWTISLVATCGKFYVCTRDSSSDVVLFCLLAERNSTQVNDATGDIHVAESQKTFAGHLNSLVLLRTFTCLETIILGEHSPFEDDVNDSEDLKEVGFEYIVERFQVLEEFQVIFKLTLAREPRGFGFVQYSDPHDAAEAKHHMDGRVFLGRELTVVFAEENRKKPVDMRARERPSYFSSVEINYKVAEWVELVIEEDHLLVILGHHAILGLHRHASLILHRHAMQDPGLTVVIIIPLQKEGITQGACMPFASKENASSVPNFLWNTARNALSVSPQERRYSQEKSYSRSRSRSQTPNRGQSRSPARIQSRSPRRSRSLNHDDYPKEVNGVKSPSP
ncbi:hypothetical protein DKX38_005261 [Salix brachista]|uniref:RRM domain-containing protein n=1 Tax=Salix brachista TaxID=2182728 RepID=A0A5N5NDY5_9ROSI|nr:hypothetical protein DKX38_005261 [Salix brachista]